jgi:ribosomal protein L1
LFFTDDAIEENILSFLATVMKLRPKGVKGAPSETNFVKDVMLSSTMGKRSYRVQKYATRALQHAGGID